MNFKDLQMDLYGTPDHRIVFVGLGNPQLSNDCAGLIVMEQIKRHKLFRNAHFIKAFTTPENNLQEILDYKPELVVIIDTADWGGQPGVSCWITGSQIENLAISTHSYSISLIEKYLIMNGVIDVRYLVVQPAFIDWKTEIGIYGSQ